MKYKSKQYRTSKRGLNTFGEFGVENLRILDTAWENGYDYKLEKDNAEVMIPIYGRLLIHDAMRRLDDGIYIWNPDFVNTMKYKNKKTYRKFKRIYNSLPKWDIKYKHEIKYWLMRYKEFEPWTPEYCEEKRWGGMWETPKSGLVAELLSL